MPDFFDHASDVEAQTLQDQLEAQSIRAALEPKIAPSGECQNTKCGEEFAPGDHRLFCNSRCAAEHQRMQRK